MDKDKRNAEKLTEFRQRAEKRLRKLNMELLQKLSYEDAERLIQEFQMHQIELEMQNEELRRAQEELEASRNKYSDLYDFAPIGYFTFDHNGLILDVNRTGADLLWAERGSLIKKSFTQFIHKDDQEIFYRHSRKVREEKNRLSCEIRMKNKSGTQFDVRMESIAIMDRAGTYSQLRSAVSDITEGKLAEKAMRESEEKYRTLFESATDAIYLIDPETQRILDCNRKASEVIGYSLRELKAMTVAELHPAEEQAVVSKIFHKIAKLKSLSGISGIHHLRKNGELLPIEINATTIELAGKRYSLAIFRDVTDRKNIEYALRESEERYRRLSQAAFEGIIIHDGGDILDINRTFAKMFGFKTSEVLGTNWLNLFAPGSRETALRYITTGYKKPFEAIGLKKDGSLFNMEIRERSIYYQGRKSSVAVVRDISERKQAEEELRESEKRFRMLSEVAFDGIAITEQGIFLEVNKEFAKIFRYIPPELIGDHVSKLIAPECLDDVLQKILSGYDKPYETVCLRKDGKRFPVEVSAKSFPYKDRILRITAIRDISKRKQIETQLREATITDDLTGLFNRRGFFTMAEKQCKIANRMKKKMSLFYLDVDDLKTMNDQFGHNAGDQALMDTATILRKTFRESDIIGRTGGDEFAVVLTEVSGTDIENTIISHIHDNLRMQNARDSRDYTLSFSIGMAHCDPEHPCSFDKLLSRADALMQEEKKNKIRQKLLSSLRGEPMERRAHTRFSADDTCRAELDTSERIKIKDISLGGMRIKSSQPLSANTFLGIKEISCGHEKITADSTVIWSFCIRAEDEECTYEAGLRFNALRNSAKRSWETIISTFTD